MSDREELFKLVKEKAVKIGEFTLTSGVKSNFYFDGKQITLDPKGSYLISKIIYEMIKGSGCDAIGGPTLGADPMVAVVSAYSSTQTKKLPAFIVRAKPKEHGLQKWVEGIIEPGWKVVIVDDVVTKAGSILKAIKVVEDMGCKVVQTVSIVDREEGGTDALKDYNFTPIFRKSEFIK